MKGHGVAGTVVATFLIAFVLMYAGIELAAGLGEITPSGAKFDLRTGQVLSVEPDSAAARAGLRSGDRLDFSRGGWQLHLSTNRTDLMAGRPTLLPMIREGRSFIAELTVPSPKPPSDAWTHYVNIAVVFLYSMVGAVLYFMRRSTPTLVLFAFACGQATHVDNLAPLRVSTPEWMPFAMVLGSIGPTLFDVFGPLYFALLFSNDAPWVSKARRYIWTAPALLFGLYYYHFYEYTIWPERFDSYLVYSVLQWIMFAVAAVAITARLNREGDNARLRWVAVGIWAQAIIFAIFFIDENVTARSSGGTPFVNYMFAWFAPATFCFAYVLARTRVIDVRVVGARTLVYGLLTAIPIALFSMADWFFSRRLADARLATFAEFAIAVAFGVGLTTLHRRIDRFVQRMVFSARYHGFTRIRHAIHAMPSAERSATVFSLLTEEAGRALGLASAAVFIERGVFEFVAGYAWDGCDRALDLDDPLVLFARADGHVVHLRDVAPSHIDIPDGDARPEIAIPIVLDHHIYAIAFYGRHDSGEHLDGEEEDLLCELAHASGTSLGRLRSAERIKELEAQNVLLMSGMKSL
jgi:hypothetical protein